MKIYNFLIPLLIFAFGAVNCGRDLFGPDLQTYPGDLADTRFNNVILEHDYQWLIGQQESLWDPPFFYPAKNMLAGSDNHLGTFLLYVPWRLAGFNETRSFQLWVFCLFVLNFFVFYKVARKLGLNATASAAGAFLFTFSIPVLGSVHHIQTLCKFTFPLVFYFLYRVLFHQQKKNILYLSLAFVHVFYCSIYYGVFTSVLAIFFVAAALFMQNRLKQLFSRENLWWLLASGAVLFLLVPLLYPYKIHEVNAIDETYEQLLPMLPHPYSYLMPHPGTMFYPFMFEATKTHTDIFWFHYFFIGFASLVLIFFALYQLRSEKTGHRHFFVLCAISLLGGILMTSAAGKYSVYQYLVDTDVFNHLKLVNRIILLELMMMGMLVAYSLNKIKLSSTKSKFLLGALTLLVCGEHWMKRGYLKYIPIDEAQHHHEYINAALDQDKKQHKVFVVLKNGRNEYENVVQVDAMMAALQKNLETLNGYTTVYPKDYFIYTGERIHLGSWIFNRLGDTVETPKTILFIP